MCVLLVCIMFYVAMGVAGFDFSYHHAVWPFIIHTMFIISLFVSLMSIFNIGRFYRLSGRSLWGMGVEVLNMFLFAGLLLILFFAMGVWLGLFTS